MFENNEKGSFGSYSSFGKYAAMTHYAIVHKKEFLKPNKEKIKHFDKFFDNQKNEDDDNLNSHIYSIFDNIHPKIQYNRNLKICKGEDDEKNDNKIKKNNKMNIEEDNNENNNVNKELYKYHKQNHKEIFNLILKKKGIKRYDPSSVKYYPKLEYIWKKVLGPPIFSSMTGRNDRKFFGNNMSNSNSSPIILNKNNKMNKKFSKEYICRKAISLLENISNQDKKKDKNPRKEQRIKKAKINDKSCSTNSFLFNNKEIIQKIKINKKIISNLKKSNSEKELNYNKTDLLNNNEFPNHKTTTIDFSKTPSREYINFLHRNREISNEYINPNFDVIYPKSISMVKYNNNFTKRKNRNYNEFEGYNFSSYFDISKSFYKINNNKEGKKIIFDHMTSRPKNNSLPVFMIRNDRNAINSITNKTLEMNNFSNSNFMTNYSSFDKKSFNNKINKNLKKNQKNSFNNCNKLTKNKSSSYLFKYYLNNFEDDSLSKLEDKIDGITFKIYKKKVNLPKEEYDRFIIN